MHKVLKNLEDKKILILGFGKEGKSTQSFLKKHFPNKQVDIADQSLSKGYLDNLDSYEVIFKTPGIPNKLPQIKAARAKGVIITSQTKLFFQLCQAKIIGVTGTKGKSTTASLIHHVLSSSGIKSTLLGNIGKPCLDYLDDLFEESTYFCFELSSHQLSDLDISPHIAVLLNIYREHLDYYESFEDYLEAKLNITRYQSEKDYLIFNPKTPEFSNIEEITKAQNIPFSVMLAKEYGKESNLVGEHNFNNIAAAIEVAKVLGIDENKIKNSLKTFQPLEHRMQTVGKYNDITFVEDSLATIPEATIAAINSYSGKIGCLILGGSDRGQRFEELAKVIIEEKIENLVFFPTTGEKIWHEIKKIDTNTKIKNCFANNMEEAVKFCFENTPKGKICLLSTASPSFTIFKDYEDKATQFKKHIKEYPNIS